MGGEEIVVGASGSSYRVLVEEGVINDSGRILNRLFAPSRALLVSDRNVFPRFGEMVVSALSREKWQVATGLISPGERSKTLAAAGRLFDAAVAAGLDRAAPVIALGGGVVGDLAGFVAATYLRGVPLVMLPTSLLAQVDSSVGGKVAVNHPGGKNLVGAFYPPRLVLIDPSVLDTLPRRQLKAGLAEVIKYAVIGDAAFFSFLERELPRLLAGDRTALTGAVIASVRAKARVVEDDELERDRRRILNFGHTIGHALEAATAYRHYLHGEAVLVGMGAATELAARLDLLEKAAEARIKTLLLRVGLKKPPPGLTVEAVIDKLRQDKKRRDRDTVFVLPRAIGTVLIRPVNDRRLIGAVIDSYLRAGG